MSKRLFGTDGIRGRVNQGAIKPANFVRFGEALGAVLRQYGDDAPRVLIGRDTRASGHMIEAAILSGLVNAGVHAETCGVLPTPAIGYLTREYGYSAGLMITASHNPVPDNGVKVFGSDGFKLSGSLQDEIERFIHTDEDLHVDVTEMHSPIAQVGYQEAYARFAAKSIGDVSLSGMSICLDAANGAGAGIAAELFERLGARVTALGVEPDGRNINLDCGALHPETLGEAVLRTGADIGLAFDGDADRIILVDEAGETIDGDQIMGAIGLDFHERSALQGGAVVATIMSNLGLEAALSEKGIKLERTAVGDRYVVQRMREGGFNVGGEQSGHVVLSDFVTTGDAIISALQILAIMKRKGQKASDVLNVFTPVPQVLKNVRYGESDPLDSAHIQDRIDAIREKLGRTGRLVIRKSGTEPVIRVMVEAYDPDLAESSVDDLIGEITSLVEKEGSAS